MGEIRVTIDLPTGESVELPLAQALTLADVLGKFDRAVWHFNECGCCISVHERGDGTSGYVIDRHGGVDHVVASDDRPCG